MGEVEGQIIGVLVLSQMQPNIVEIMNTVVDKDFQGKGIGKQLIHQAIKKQKKERIKQLKWGLEIQVLDS